MEARGGVRSSARLSSEAARGTGSGSSGNGNGRPAEVAAAAAAAAAERRARAAERSREVEDSPRVLREKCRRLARALRNAKHLVVYTGAGISTAADIPDYRGPHGVWTRLQRGEAVGRVEVSRAEPTFTHMALTALWARGALKFVVSQNCDGLHLRAGMPRRALAELHGDMFAELCGACRRVYLRAFDTTERTARHAHATRRLCHACGAELRDSIVHFGERGRAAWPLNWAGALRHAARADVVLCLGSSLKVLRRYPRLWRMQAAPRARPALYIVNLQWTPKDGVAALKINARCDTVMRQVARRLRLRVPRYRADRDPLLAHAEPLLPAEAHTTRRPLLREPRDASLSASSDLSSPSASDSDEEVPLTHLAERLRVPPAPAPAPPPPKTHPPGQKTQPPDLYRRFQVSMRSGHATILLRAEHAPCARPPPPEPPPRVPPPFAPPGSLRSFRMIRPRPAPAPALANGTCAPLPPVKKEEPDAPNGGYGLGSRLRRLLECEPRLGDDAKPKPEPKRPKEEASSSDESCGAGALAAAIIARAVLLCRAQLYPGLHTILAPPAPAPAPAECAWCLRRHAARRCLWYGAARLTPAAARAWRRVRGARAARVLCACCTEPGTPRAPAPAPAPDEGGWYGKGYRKGRRKRR